MLQDNRIQNRLTIKNIAHLGGVGKSTVSRVLNNESGMNQHTRERVEAVMNQHGFSPSCSTRTTRGQSNKVVTTTVTRLDSLSGNFAIQIMLPALYKRGYNPAMMESQFPPQLVAEHLGALERCGISGVVLFSFTSITEEMLTRWQSSLALLARGAKGFASVCYDDEGATKILMQRLYDQKHRNIGYLDMPHSDVMTGKRRHEAYLAFCKAHELHPVVAPPGLVMRQDYENVARMTAPETTALLCATGTLALGTSKYLQEQHIDTLQPTSIGNTPLMKFLHPEIVTVDPGYAETGRQVACQLTARVTGCSEPQQIIIPATLS